MGRTYLLIVTAFVEVGTGLLLLIWPSLPLALLLGIEEGSPELNLCARVLGAALLAIGVACWFGRSDKHGPAPFGLLISVLLYDVAAAVILAHAGLSGLAGIALWPAVVLHAALAVWCVVCLWDTSRDGAS
jgi:hypothetical protein